MRYLPTVGLYWKNSGQNSLNSGIYYSTQPTDIPYNALAVEDGKVFEFIRLSATCTVGALLYYTGTAMQYVTCSSSGKLPCGIAMVKPTTSGVWTWMLKYGKCTTVQITASMGAGTTDGLSCPMFGGHGSAAVGLSTIITNVASGTMTAAMVHTYIGESFTDSTGSTTVGFIKLL